MADSRAESVLCHLNHLLASSGAAADDGRLLERFVRHRDEAAFAELVVRHGPLVFGLCRRLLVNVQDAEDVFQAAFFVLARKAATIRKPESLSCWLHGVASRLALKMRADTERRRSHERQAAAVSEIADVDLSWREVRGLIDEELQRLPQKQRLPLVLCYLEGLTQDEASRRLGWPRGTLKRRLETGRERLRLRLTRRGVTLGASLFAVALTESAAKGAMSPALRNATVRAGIQFLTQEAAAFAASPAAVLLAKGFMQTMLTTKLKIASVVLVLLACAGFGASQLVQQRSTPGAAAAHEEADHRKKSSDKAKTAEEVQAELRRMRGTWTMTGTETHSENGELQTVKEITIKVIIMEDKIISLGKDGSIWQEFTFRLDPSQKPKTIDLVNRKIDTLQGIYRLEGDSLKIHLGIGKRPSEFPAQANPETLLWDLKRVSHTPEKPVARFPNAPGCFWMIEPDSFGMREPAPSLLDRMRQLIEPGSFGMKQPGSSPALIATLGIVYLYEKDRDGAALITLAAALPDREPEYRPVLLDVGGKRYLPEAFGSSGSSGRLGGPTVSLQRWRSDPKVLPAEKVARIGIEALTPEYHRIAARTALERTRKEGIEVLPCPEIGKPFDFVLTTIDGKKIRSHDLRGKVVLIDCWATWCSPCRALLPKWKELYEKSHKDGLEILGVSFDRDAEKLRKTCTKAGLTWPQVLVPSDEKTRQLWREITGTGGIPRLFLIDREGVLRADNPAPAKLQEEIARLLKSTDK